MEKRKVETAGPSSIEQMPNEPVLSPLMRVVLFLIGAGFAGLLLWAGVLLAVAGVEMTQSMRLVRWSKWMLMPLGVFLASFFCVRFAARQLVALLKKK